MTKIKASKSDSWDIVLASLVDSGVIPGTIHRVLLLGPPGTGKSTWACRQFGDVERVELFREQSVDELRGAMVLDQQNGATVTRWADGPAVRAMRKGCPLILDELDQHSADCRATLHALLDDLSIAGITLPTGERVTPQPGFCVIGTMNAEVSKLPKALFDRFELPLYVGQPSTGAMQQLSQRVRTTTENVYSRTRPVQWSRELTYRAASAIDRLARAGVDMDIACWLVVGAAGEDTCATILSQCND